MTVSGGPLAGRRIAVTRSSEQGSELASRLAALGASVVEAPCIRIDDAADGGAALRSAASDLEAVDWVVLSSPNGARRLLDAVGDPARLCGVGVAAPGPGTAAVLRAAGVTVDLVPRRHIAEGVVEEFPRRVPGVGTGRVVVINATVARDVIVDGLSALGWDVTVVDAYRTVPADFDPAVAVELADVELVTFMSGSAARGFVDVYGAGRLAPAVASVGPVTTGTAEALGIVVDVEADDYTLDGLVDAVLAWAGEPPRGSRG